MTILVADAVGYSRLMSIDDVETLAALDGARGVFRASVQAHGGRVVDMAGDSVLATFETATGAVQAALAIQQRLEGHAHGLPEAQRLRFRIGLHLGDVIEKADGTVYGDGVNIAARLQALAAPGRVHASHAVVSAVGGRIDARFDDLGEQIVKNLAQPVRTFSVRGKADPADVPTAAV
ncbi:MAG TPA: adenylate/guanylate cyclase domain-containing protein, partial [Vicinamibacterales bacterium]|nr:adenylate/guanylate cyclase domain-containing protein [Vicinamibacterales bacterium]